MPRRASEPSQCRRTVSGLPSRMVLRRGKPRFSRPHLEAISTSGGRFAQRAADERLVVAAPVQHRRVEVRDAQLDRAPQRALGDRIVLRIEVVAPRCAHAAEADARDARGRLRRAAAGGARSRANPMRTPRRMSGSMYRTLEGSLRGQFRSHRNSDHRGHHRVAVRLDAVFRASRAARASTCARRRTRSARSRTSSRAACARSIRCRPSRRRCATPIRARPRAPKDEDRLERHGRQRLARRSAPPRRCAPRARPSPCASRSSPSRGAGSARRSRARAGPGARRARARTRRGRRPRSRRSRSASASAPSSTTGPRVVLTR